MNLFIALWILCCILSLSNSQTCPTTMLLLESGSTKTQRHTLPSVYLPLIQPSQVYSLSAPMQSTETGGIMQEQSLGPTFTIKSQVDAGITLYTSTASIAYSMTSVTSSVKSTVPTEIHNDVKKNRFNFASFDCGALFLSSNPGSREGSAIIQNTKDRYMLNKCSALHKWFEIEFCEEILVESIQLANYELFSSTYKDFKVFVNNKYPPTLKNPWMLLGKFTARNVRGKQIFPVENPLIWAKYLRVVFLTHYGTEYYCPFSQIKVFGTTMMEEVQEEEKALPIQPTPSLQIQSTILQESLPVLSTATSKIPSHSSTVSLILETESTNTKLDICKSDFNSSSLFIQELFCTSSTQQEENSPKTTLKSTSNRVIQESIFKNIIKRLNVLEESSTATLESLSQQQKSLKFILDSNSMDREEQIQVLMNQDSKELNLSQIKKKKLDSILLEILNDQSQMKKRLDAMDSTIAKLKEDHFLYQLMSQVLFAFLILFGRYLFSGFFTKSQETSKRTSVVPTHIVTSNPNDKSCRMSNQNVNSGLQTPVQEYDFSF